MINIFNELYTGLSTALGSAVNLANEDTNTPKTYPTVSMVEIDDSVYTKGSDSCSIENLARKVYEINVYTKHPSKKSKCDTLCGTIDTYFSNLGFTRTMKMPMPTGDETTYRVVMRYEGICSTNKTIYRG